MSFTYEYIVATSYIHMTDLVDQMFPPVHRKVAGEFTDFNYWRAPIQDFELPNLEPPSPALSARSDTSRLSRLGLPSFGLRGKGSSQSLADNATKPNEKRRGTAPRASSPLSSPVLTPNDPGEAGRSRSASFTGESLARSLYDRRLNEVPDDFHLEPRPEHGDEGEEHHEEEDAEDQAFDDDLLATGEMDEIPYL